MPDNSVREFLRAPVERLGFRTLSGYILSIEEANLLLKYQH